MTEKFVNDYAEFIWEINKNNSDYREWLKTVPKSFRQYRYRKYKLRLS